MAARWELDRPIDLFVFSWHPGVRMDFLVLSWAPATVWKCSKGTCAIGTGRLCKAGVIRPGRNCTTGVTEVFYGSCVFVSPDIEPKIAWGRAAEAAPGGAGTFAQGGGPGETASPLLHPGGAAAAEPADWSQLQAQRPAQNRSVCLQQSWQPDLWIGVRAHPHHERGTGSAVVHFGCHSFIKLPVAVFKGSLSWGP